MNKKYVSAMVWTALGASAFSTAANAADGKAQYRDIRNKTPGYVELAGPTASGKNRIALMVKGGDEELIQKIWIASQHIEATTDRDVWFIRSSGDDLSDKKTLIEIYVSGRKTGTLTVYDRNLINEKLVAVVRDGIRRMTKRH